MFLLFKEVSNSACLSCPYICVCFVHVGCMLDSYQQLSANLQPTAINRANYDDVSPSEEQNDEVVFSGALLRK